MVSAVVVEGAHSHALRTQQFGVDVGDAAPFPLGEALGFGQQDAVLVDHRLAVPSQVRRGLALACGREDVGGQAARRRRAGQQLAVVGAADRDGAAGEVGEHRRSGQRGLGAGRDRHPHVLADLNVQHEVRQVARGEQQVGAERHVRARDADGAAFIVARSQLPAFVELAVRRQVRLRHHAQHCATVDHHRGVVDPVAVPQRGSDDEHRQELPRGRDDVGQRHADGVEQGVLHEDVLDGVARQRQLREHHQGHAVVMAVAGHAQHGFRVGRGVGQRGVVGTRGHPHEPVPVGGEEGHVLIVSGGSQAAYPGQG